MNADVLSEEYTALLDAVKTHAAHYQRLSKELSTQLDAVTKDAMRARSIGYDEMAEVLSTLSIDYAKIAQHFRDASYFMQE